MPGTSDSRLETIHLQAHLDAARKIAALQRNGQQIWSNAQHQRVSQAGLHVEDGTYGHWYFDANSQQPVLKHGEQDDGTFGQWSLDENGNVILKVGQIKINGAIYYGMGIYNSSGTLIGLIGNLYGGGDGIALYNAFGVAIATLAPNGLTITSGTGVTESQLGLLPDGTYGMAQLARQGVSSGNMVDIGLLCSPVLLTANSFSTTSTTYSGGPSGSATIGSSGVALITVTCGVYVSATNCTGAMGLFIDGTDVWDGIIYVENNSGGGIGGNQSNVYLATGLSEGSHTFALQGKSSLAGTQVTFGTPTIIVQPY